MLDQHCHRRWAPACSPTTATPATFLQRRDAYSALENQLSIYSLLVSKVVGIAQTAPKAAGGAASAPQSTPQQQQQDQPPPPQQQQLDSPPPVAAGGQLFAVWRLEEVVAAYLWALASFYRNSHQVIEARFVAALWQHLVLAAPSAAVRRDALRFLQQAASAKDCWLEERQLAELLQLAGELPSTAMTLGVAMLAWRCFFEVRRGGGGRAAGVCSWGLFMAQRVACTGHEA